MFAVADTDKLVADQIISPEQARTIEERARDALVVIAINTLLCLGIVAATGGLIFWLESAKAVAICGILTLATGLFILARGGEMFRMFGNAAALIGAGMLIGGASLELMDKYENVAGGAMLAAGVAVALASGWSYAGNWFNAKFVIGSIFLLGIAMHLGGAMFLLEQDKVSGLPISLFYLYATTIIIASGWYTNVRLVTALAILPFAQALDTGTFYFDALYAFYSPESTLSILQLAVMVGLAIWVASRASERTARHARILAVMAFIVANLCALVGSLWGDVVGETIWGPGSYGQYYAEHGKNSWQQYKAAREAFRTDALIISEGLYAILWAIALAAMVIWAAFKNQRGLFNTTLTFAGIHGYTQMFESFGDEPLAYVIAGLSAIPLAWGMWRLNHWLTTRAAPL